MSQMISFIKLQCGFFIYPKNRKLYFARPHGDWTILFLVTDGVIADSTNVFSIKPDEEVEVLEKDDWAKHGITDETLKKRFKEFT